MTIINKINAKIFIYVGFKRAPGWGKRAPGWGKRAASAFGGSLRLIRAPGWGKRAPGWGKRAVSIESTDYEDCDADCQLLNILRMMKNENIIVKVSIYI